MSTTIRCSVCGNYFSSTENYRNHLPCSGGSRIYGGAGDVRSGSQEVIKEGGTGER